MGLWNVRPPPFLSTPSARRATGGDSDVPTHGKISIHALREEGDLVMLGNTLGTLISIHALREEGDRTVWGESAEISCYFYPRPPRGGRPDLLLTDPPYNVFLSTPSARRATVPS